MKKITAFKLTDGRIIEDEAEATRLEKEGNFRMAIQEFSEEVGCHRDEIGIIYDAIMANRTRLRDIFLTM